ncbi:MAG: family 20 glycosylhydrolase [Clostridiaceae bacterium]|nr:family 20 glycosylhydrolase [Clostridiaceae bacterium]
MVLIPYPRKLEEAQGTFRFSDMSLIFLDTSCDYAGFEAAQALRDEIVESAGVKPAITRGEYAGGAAAKAKNTVDPAGMIVLRKTGRPGASKSGGPGSGASKKSVISALRAPSANTAADNLSLQSYTLTVDSDAIVVTGNGSSGLYYGIQTLRQLIRNYGAEIPCLRIEDSPTLEYRGFYHDITRGKVPTLETLKELADRLSFYKINQLQLYIEHSFAFRRLSEIWTDTDPLTAEEILVLDEYCRRRSVELVPSLSSFGHLYHVLISKSFRHLNEYDEIPDRPFTWTDRMAHYTLDASAPGSLAFVREMIDEFIPLFSSDKFNICCDETFDLGRGKNRALAAEIGEGKLYLYFVRELIEHLRSRKKKVMMWGDMLLHYPEIIGEIPKNVVILNWDYAPDAGEDGFRKISEAGLKQYVCPGVQGWNKLLNNIDAATANIGKLAGYAKTYGAIGMLNTDWGDFGHINALAGSIPGAIYGAGLSWNPDRPDQPTDEEISVMEYGDRSGKIVGLIRELSRQPVMDWYDVVLWYYASSGYDTGPYGSAEHIRERLLGLDAEAAKTAFGRIRELSGEISSLAGSIYEDRKNDIREMICAADGLALFQALLLVIKKELLGQASAEPVLGPGELAVRLEYWFSAYKSVWRARNKESELFRIKEVIMGICRLLRDI